MKECFHCIYEHTCDYSFCPDSCSFQYCCENCDASSNQCLYKSKDGDNNE